MTWITIQITYILLSIYAPLFIKKLKEKKSKVHIVHFISVLVGIMFSFIIPFILTLGLGGYSLVDTKFPPAVCVANNLSGYLVVSIPVSLLFTLTVTELIVILHYLFR